MNYSWTLPGQRKLIPYENSQNRRVNVMAAYVAEGPRPSLTWSTAPRSWDADDLVTFIRDGVPRGDGPMVVVLDNASIHCSKVVREARKGLREQGIELFYLPPYSPKLNTIEPVFGVIKHHELPERRYESVDALTEAIDCAFTKAEERLFTRSQHYLRLAA